jgi:hypothetical protein
MDAREILSRRVTRRLAATVISWIRRYNEIKPTGTIGVIVPNEDVLIEETTLEEIAKLPAHLKPTDQPRESRPTAEGWWWAEKPDGTRTIKRVITCATLALTNPSFVNETGYLICSGNDQGHWPVGSMLFDGWRWVGPMLEPPDFTEE